MKNMGLLLAGGLAVLIAILCIGTLFLARSAALQQMPPKNMFRLKVETLQDTGTLKSFQLTLTGAGILTDQNTLETTLPVAVQVEAGLWCMTRASVEGRAGLCRATIPITATQIDSAQGGRNINLAIYVNALNGRSGGSGTYAIPGKTLPEVFILTAKNGDYPIEAPLTIGTIQGKPIRILVGEAALNQQRLMTEQNKQLNHPSVRPIK
jgi:hypothetical protein